MSNSQNKRVAIIGAGPAGLTAAYKLSEAGIQIDLFEAGSAVGGMAKTISLWGQLVDLGPHRFFSSDPRVNRLWLEIIGQQYSMVNRLTRIYYKNIFFDYPLKAFNTLFGLGVFQSTLCILSYIKAKFLPEKSEKTFEAWVSNRFGKKLYGIFFKSYSEKLWGISCKDLDADFAAQRIKKLSLYEAIKSAIFSGGGKISHKTLVDEFAYPHHGAGEVYDLMAAKVKGWGGRIHLNTPIDSVQLEVDELVKPSVMFVDGQKIHFDHIISSMPITQLIEKIGAPYEICNHAKALTFRNTILVYLQIDGGSSFPDQWIYVHSSDLKTGRITNFKNWNSYIDKGKSETILCLEYWCYDSDSIWEMDESALIELATREIYSTGLITRGSVMAGKVYRVPKCYPVYATGYREHLKPIEEFLSTKLGLSVIGRYGSFKYNNQDHSILMGLLAAENILSNKAYDLWGVNTDYEYQESCRITATGLIWDNHLE